MKTLAGIIEARMYDIIDYVKIEIERCGFKGRLGAGIVLTGGGANLKNLDLLFKMHTGMDVRIAQPVTYVAADSVELVSAPKYSTLTGIVLDAVRKGNYTEIDAAEPAQAAGGYDSSYTPEADSYEGGQQEGGYEPDSYGMDGDEEYLDDYPEEELRLRRPKLSERVKRWFGGMFTDEEVDDDDSY